MEKRKEVIIIISIVTIIITLMILCFSKTKEYKKEKISIEEKNLIGYTINGEKAEEKPSKELGYIANKITCTNNSNIVWDNDLWEVEIIESALKDRCIVDFTKEETSEGYRVRVTSSIEGTLESYNKATTNGGIVKIYPKKGYRITGHSGCNAEIKNNILIVKNVTENTICNVTTSTNTLADKLKEAYPSKGERTDFSNIYTETGMHETVDDQGTTYYFTGNPNNWVSFAGKLWRVIRINGDGSVRLLYAGSGGEDGYLTDEGQTAYNPSYNHPSYVGWKYSVGGSLEADRENSTVSPIYNKVKTWYDKLSSTDKAYINTNAVYCNDRNITSGSYSTSSTFYYAGYTRFVTNKNAPTLSCHTSDQFKDGFGLMTADEVVMAGGLYGTNNPNVYYYLNKDGGSATGSNWWWTMSPFGFNQPNNSYDTYVFDVLGSTYPGHMSWASVNFTDGVIRPVISLKKEVIVTRGDGTGNNPYEITMPTLAETIKIDANKKGYASGERTNFTEVYNENGLHKTIDDQGETYYYTGNPDNWVSFAGKLWRIIRINGDGSVRLLYAGSGGEDGYIGETAFNTKYDDPMYVGWRYGTSGSLENNRTNENKSEAYKTVENWYNTLSETVKSFINTNAIYCNDRSINTEYDKNSIMPSAAHDRMRAIPVIPTLKCNINDSFKDGFGLMTVDEISFAGGSWHAANKNPYYDLNKSGGSSTGDKWWWTMTPYAWGDVENISYMFGQMPKNGLANSNITYTYALRPVISLKKEVIVTSGDGSGNSPYEITMQS